MKRLKSIYARLVLFSGSILLPLVMLQVKNITAATITAVSTAGQPVAAAAAAAQSAAQVLQVQAVAPVQSISLVTAPTSPVVAQSVAQVPVAVSAPIALPVVAAAVPTVAQGVAPTVITPSAQPAQLGVSVVAPVAAIAAPSTTVAVSIPPVAAIQAVAPSATAASTAQAVSGAQISALPANLLVQQAQIPNVQAIGANPGEPISLNFQLVNAQHELVACSSVPLSGGASLLGRDLTYGFNLIFNKAKQSGGINGVTVNLSTLDDHNAIVDSEKNVFELIKKSPLFMGNFGTEQLLAILPLIEQKKMVMLFPFTGSNLLRKAEYTNIVHYRASLSREVAALTNYAVKRLFKRKIAVFYEDNRWGEDGCKAVEDELKKLGLTLAVKSSYPQNTVNILAAAQEMGKARPSAIICIAHSRPAYNFIQNVINSGMQNCAFLGISELTPMHKLIKASRGVTLVTSSLVPDPFHSELPIVKQYRDDMKALLSNVAISPFSLEGYVSATLFAQAIKQIQLPLTVDKLIKSFESFKNVDIGGIKVSFDPEVRSLSDKVWINHGEEREWELSS